MSGYSVICKTIADYRYLKNELLSLGYTIQSATLDGKRGLTKAFKDIPIQMCHFHQKKIVSRLTLTTEKNFTQKLDEWCEIYQDFLDEKSISSTTGELHYTHPRIRAAYRSLRTNLPYLFTCKNYKKLSILLCSCGTNTTNALEGGVFSHMKNMISLHRGLSKSLKVNLVENYAPDFLITVQTY